MRRLKNENDEDDESGEEREEERWGLIVVNSEQETILIPLGKSYDDSSTFLNIFGGMVGMDMGERWEVVLRWMQEEEVLLEESC